jgi:hypothetical protein
VDGVTDDVVSLAPREVAPDHPFTDPAHTDEDVAILREMLDGVRWALSRDAPAAPRPFILVAPEPHRRQHRVVLAHEARLRDADELGVVGFFARKRTDRDCSPLTAVDDELILEFPRHPGILSYSSLELADGNWGNLILFHPPEAKDDWRRSERHAYAASELAPRYYTVVRLHNARLPGGLWSGRDVVLVRTKYYDFQGPAPWRAEREIPSGMEAP